MESQSRKLTLKEKICYGFGDCGGNVTVALVGTFLPAYYTDTVGIAAAAIGTMMLVTRVFDGITDIIMGAIVDRTKTRWGKARPWVLWTAPFVALALFLVFNVPSGLDDHGKLLWAYLTYIFQSCIVGTANGLPYQALLSRMSLDVQDRASATSIRFVMTQITGLVVNSATSALFMVVGWRWLSILYGIILFIMMIACFFGTREYLGEDEEGNVKVDSVPLTESFSALLVNKYFYMQALMFILFYIGVVGTNSMTFYYCNIVLGVPAFLTFTTISGTVPAMVVNMILPKLIYRYGKRKLMIVGSVLIIVGSIVVGSARTNLPLIMFGLILKGIGMGPIMSGIFAMTADVVDYGEWKTGVRSEGLVNSCTSFGMKVGVGLGSAVSSWILAAGGYDGLAAVQTESAIEAIRFGYGYLGAIVQAGCLILLFIMNLDKYMKKIQEDLESRHA